MGLFDTITASDALIDLLERERGAVLEGRFDVLERLSSEKERLIRAVARSDAEAEILARLKTMSMRNGRLLDSMRLGVAAAQNRLKILKTPPKPLETYDQNGQRNLLSPRPKAQGHRV